MVAFFLMNGRAVLIPSVAVAVSLLGTLGVMFLLGFSLDNLSLMALTVSTGFVVDDAIVVLENVTRHVEAGMGRFEAALQGAQEVGFTVLSISISLIAVFMPILLMGGIFGRLFREFAITLSAAILVSLVISLTTTPMMAAYLVGTPKPPSEQELVRAARRRAASTAMRRVYERALDWALDSGPVMLVDAGRDHRAQRLPLRDRPQGLLPRAGHRPDGRRPAGRPVQLVPDHPAAPAAVRRTSSARDPAVQTVVAFVGGGRGAASAFMFDVAEAARASASTAPSR